MVHVDSMKTAILIPARYHSSRFPGKPLTKLGDRHMIQEVYVKCKESGLDTYVLTDHPLIADLFADNNVVIDQAPYENGTERCSGALKDIRFDQYTHFINVQGDMPDVTVEMIHTTNRLLEMNYDVATLFTRMDEKLQNDPNVVKLVTDHSGSALWFARGITGYGEHHLGVYGYTRKSLYRYSSLPIFHEEMIENLEQLRWIKNSLHIQCGIVNFNGIEINTPEDADKWNGK